MSGQVATIRSRDEIESAIRAFTDADRVRLYRVAQRYAFGRAIEPEDLLQEALVRALDSRNCPTHVDVVKFLAEAMRSIAHGEAEKAKTRPVVISIAGAGDYQSEALNHPDPSPSVEEKIIGEENIAVIRRSVLALFDDDPQARDIMEGRIVGLNAEELRELTGLDKTAYDSKCKLIRRRLNKAYPEGWKP